jgi:hypothetical protein
MKLVRIICQIFLKLVLSLLKIHWIHPLTTSSEEAAENCQPSPINPRKPITAPTFLIPCPAPPLTLFFLAVAGRPEQVGDSSGDATAKTCHITEQAPYRVIQCLTFPRIVEAQTVCFLIISHVS